MQDPNEYRQHTKPAKSTGYGLSNFNFDVTGFAACPFCGSEGRPAMWRERAKSVSRYRFAVRCRTCQATGPRSLVEVDAKTLWNARTLTND